MESPHSLTPEPSPSLLSLSPEIRLLILAELVILDKPFLIGRCQDKKTFVGSPRDLVTARMRPKPPTARRTKRKHRPKQPAISRVCRLLRAESLPLFYSENDFWLIHNEFFTEEYSAEFTDLQGPYGSAQQSLYPVEHQVSAETATFERGFAPWIAQTPRKWFDTMQYVSICGYGATWPSRYMVNINLKTRQLRHIQHYTTYDEELPIKPEFSSEIQGVLDQDRELRDAFETLEILLKRLDWMFEICGWMYDSPPTGTTLAEGWGFEW